MEDPIERKRRITRARQARFRARINQDPSRKARQAQLSRERYAKMKQENIVQYQNHLKYKAAKNREIQATVKVQTRDDQDDDHELSLDRVKDPNYSKCRMCLKDIGLRESRVVINSAVRKQFLEVTQTSLVNSDKLPKVMCIQCHRELRAVCVYRKKAIETQQKLMDEIPNDDGHAEEIFVVEIKTEKEMDFEDEHRVDDFAGSYVPSDEDRLLTPMEPKVEPPDLSTYDGRYTRLSTAGTQPEMAIIKGSFTCNYCGIKLFNKKTLDQHKITQHHQEYQ